MKEEEIVEVLKRESEDFRRLCQEHRQLDAQIADFNKKSYLTSEEELEKKRVQKEKLQKKDKIAEMIRQYKKQHPVN